MYNLLQKGGEKILKKLGLVGILTFLVLFVYFYKTSGKFRQSVLAAFVAGTVGFGLLSSQPAQAGEADAFPIQPQHQSRPSHRSGFFSGRSSNDGSGPGKPNSNDSNNDDGDDGSSPKYPKRESIEETQEHLFNIDEQINKLEEVTDSDSESECASAKQFQVDFDFELDKNGNPRLIIPMKDGNIRRIEFDQTRDK